jgi:hypothetical protein
MKASIVEKFIEKITNGKSKYHDRFYEIFTARGFLLKIDSSSEKVRLSDESHQDSINEDDRHRHAYFDDINIQLFDINNIQYLNEVFMNEIPIDLFRLNWERDWYGKFNQFKEIEHLPKVRVYDLEPFIARLAKAISSIGISTWSSCEGHWGKPAYIIFDRKYHRVWFQTILNRFIKKKLNLVCDWHWQENRCTISNLDEDQLELYLELQDAARLIYDYRFILRNMKKQLSSLLTNKHKNMNKKELLSVFEGFFEESGLHKDPAIRQGETATRLL